MQEACSNVVKHAKASKVVVSLSCEEQVLKLSIQDNGVGFDMQKTTEPSGEKPEGFGLSMMKERVALLGGTFQIKSAIGEGTMVSVEMPLQKKEETCGDD